MDLAAERQVGHLSIGLIWCHNEVNPSCLQRLRCTRDLLAFLVSQRQVLIATGMLQT